MAEEEDDSSWVLNLEAALLDDCTPASVLNICKGKSFPDRLRAEAWEACLGIKKKGDQLANFNEIYDLPEQELLREHCQQVVEKLGNDDYDKVSIVSDIEGILTYYCKSNHVTYTKENGWIELLLPLLALKRPIADTYNMFEAIITQHIPNTRTNDPYHLFRLLVLYHDPELCSFLDTKKVTPDLYAAQWFRGLFSGTCDLRVIQTMWDLYFQQNDPFFVFFLSLVIVLNGREHILNAKSDPKSEIVDIISVMPSSLEYNDVTDFCSLAQYYGTRTPASFKKELYSVLFGNDDDTSGKQSLSQALCLPVSANELVENAADTDFLEDLERVRFFLVDCRPAEQYNAGHLSTAFHLDCNLMLQEPDTFSMAVQGLLAAQKQSLDANSVAAGEHLCFLGSGRDEEDQYTHMVIASFLQKHTRFVSILSGGYQAIHDYFGSDLSDCLEEHDSQHCLVCSCHTAASSSNHSNHDLTVYGSRTEYGEDVDILDKISAIVKEKSADLKGKLIEYIVNPSSGQSDRQVGPKDKWGKTYLKGNMMEYIMNPSSSQGDRQTGSKDKVRKLYRNMAPVFSIDDDHVSDPACSTNGQVDEEEEETVVPLAKYLTGPDIKAHFKCQEVKESGYVYESHLVVTNSHLIVLREVADRRGHAVLVLKRSLSTIVTITSKKRHPDLITFKYGSADGQGLAISDMDRFMIPKASEATKIISKEILNCIKSKEKA